jgi:hypothetical protein
VKKVTDHMRDKCAKIEIKLKHNFMNIIAYRVRYNEPVAPPGFEDTWCSWILPPGYRNLYRDA